MSTREESLQGMGSQPSTMTQEEALAAKLASVNNNVEYKTNVPEVPQYSNPYFHTYAAADTSNYYTDPATGTVYTSPEVARQYGVSVDNLNPATPLTVPTSTPTPSPLPGAVAGAEATTKTLDQYIAEATPKETQTSKDVNSLIADIQGLLPGVGGRGAEQLAGEQQAGLPQMKKNLADINARLLTKIAEAKQSDTSYEKLIADLENPNNPQQQGIPMAAIIGQQAQVRKMQLAEHNAKAADIGLLQAFAQGLQGQVSAAQETVNRAIDLKYQDREDELNLKMNQLKLLEGKLSKEEEIQKTALQRKYEDEQKKIEEQKTEQKDNVKAAINSNIKTRFTNWNGKFFDTMTGVVFPDPASFFKAAGVTSFEDAYAKGLVSDVNLAADYSKYPASVQEYMFAKSQGFKGTFADYQNEDANRKKSIAAAGNVTTGDTREYDLRVKQAPSQVAVLKAQGKSWQQIADYFNALGIDPGIKEIDDALHRAFQSQKDYENWKKNQ